ncbi:hypothetical protein C7293_05525 [filamentous cyanobacterium CCT1]|nr:hypothetical protein C7293_05525 [filamentous cyanobacterium CCT1]PSN81033.1 hypothetical protein C8B47_03445 [filamentous cyanobacterium CCP4]
MLKLFVEWDGDAANLKLFLRCSSCGGIIEDSDLAVALYPVRIQSRREVYNVPITDLDWTTVYTVHSGACAYRARTLALQTYKQLEAMQLSVFLSQLMANTDALRDTRPELWDDIKREMEWDEENV